MTKVINLFAGPGAGKSTTAAHLFALFKLAGYNAELVTEYAKEIVWGENFTVLNDQIYIFAEQLHRIKRLTGKVDYIIVDSPVLLSLHYGQDHSEAFKTLVLEEHGKMDTHNVFLRRVKPYQPIGRRQDEESAKGVDASVAQILSDNLINYSVVEANEDAAKNIMFEVLSAQTLKEKQI
jgi:hypothetical protein